MSKKMGKTKNSTDDMIDNAVSQQQDWLARRSCFASEFFRSLNVFAKPSNKRVVGRPAVKSNPSPRSVSNRAVIREYWFPVLCTFAVVFMTIGVAVRHIQSYAPGVAPVPEPIVRTVSTDSNSINHSNGGK